MARPANYDFYFMIPGARLIPPLSGTDGPSRSSTNYIPWVIAHDHEATIIERQDSQTPFLEGTHLGIKRVEARTGFDQSD